jgi:glycosyltransferase involved in cell wall biosynthesis
LASRPRPIIVGSDTQHIEGLSFVSGVQRVVRETHAAMVDALSPHGIDLVPFHTRPGQRGQAFRTNPYLASDPVLDRTPLAPEELDAFLFLDLHPRADFAAVHRERRRRPRPVVSVIYDIIPILLPDTFGKEAVRSFRAFVQQILAISDVIVVNSEQVRSDLLALGWRVPQELLVVPLGSTFRSRAPEPPPDGRLSLLYVSTVEPHKGHDLLLAAFDRLRSSGLDVDLTIVGRVGWLAEGISEAIRRHPDFGGRLRWYRNADDVTMTTLARASTVGVFPSQAEGFGLFLEEGLALGLKMVVSDIPVFRERPRENVFYADRTPEALADAIGRAHAAPWVQPPPIRAMRDFGYDLAGVVRGTLP